MKIDRKAWVLLIVPVLGLAAGTPAGAWGPEGHETVGAIADTLLVGTDAEREVRKLLGTEKLATAALWADCVKGVSDGAPYTYHLNSRYPECDPFQNSSAGREQMEDYVRRNATGCQAGSSHEACHKSYHYTDVAIEHDSYDRADVGTSDQDVVSAITAAIAKLRGQTVPAPFNYATRKEALRVLAHLVGDVHQPLHVGAVYLDAAGLEVNPDAGRFDPDSKTRGGNLLIHGRSRKLHAEWDSIPRSLNASRFLSEGVAQAQLVPATTGSTADWARAWASETVGVARTAFASLSFGAEVNAGTRGAKWPVVEPAGYAAQRATLQKEQLVRAGARLAQLLEAVFP
jgi:hypothetical protein